MLRLVDPKALHPISLPFDDGLDKTIFWVRPFTEGEYARIRAKGMPTGTDDEKDVQGWSIIAHNIGKIENVNWAGQQRASFDDYDTIVAILMALPVASGRALVARLAEFCMLAGRYSKNSDGSLALLDTGSPIAEEQTRVSISGASQQGLSGSGSPESGTASTSP